MSNCCDICGRADNLKLMSSGCAPVTYAACGECRGRRAESLDVVTYWWYLEGGTDASSTYLNHITCWFQGGYVDRDIILGQYEDRCSAYMQESGDCSELVEDDVLIGAAEDVQWS